MFYIDFTSPDGRTYRIDVLNHPINFKCPTCGQTMVYAFEGDSDKYCHSCAEKRQQQELDEMDARLYRQLANYINHEHKCHITPEEAKRLLHDPDFQNSLPGICTHPKIKVIPNKKK